jgi:SAM-dependent methyltransferase
MSLRFHEIAEARHRVQNPISEAKLALIGEICRLEEKTRLLDLACGKGELLTTWAQRYGILGVGVDFSEVFIEAAKARAYELEVVDQLTFVVDNAADFPQEHHQFDVVSCVGATWIGGGLLGTLKLMQTALKPKDGMLIIGEAYWHQAPPPEVYTALDFTPETFATLAGTLDRFESLGLTLVEMVLADLDDWDRYYASQWSAVYDYLRDNPDDPQADQLRAWIAKNRRNYLTYERQYLGRGVFILR